MVTDVHNTISVSSKPPSNMSQTPSQSTSSPNSQQYSNNITQTSTHPATGTRKKKKKKNPSTSVSGQRVGTTALAASQIASHDPSGADSSEHASSSSGTSPSLDPATTEQWQQRVQGLRNAISKAQKENQLLASDLAAALARASDAEHAEDTVNKGLLTARSVISQRDRTIAELKSTASNLRAELTSLQEEKKKTDKRLILLKTVSANLQEAREHRDTAEKKVEEANGEIAFLKERNRSLEREIDSLKEQVETMEMVKQQLERRELEIDELVRGKQRAEEDGRQGEVRGFAVGVASMVAVGVIRRVLGRGGRKDNE